MVRLLLLGVIAASPLAMQDGCIPLLDDANRPPVRESAKLVVVVNRPESDVTVPQGAQVSISWAAVNRTGSQAVADVVIVSRADLSETILQGGLILSGEQINQDLVWDTAAFDSGEYSIVVRIGATTLVEEASAAGRVTVNAAPTFAFSEPAEPRTLRINGETEATVQIVWTGGDPDGDGRVEIGIDEDDDHDTGNETIIAERELTTTSTIDSLAWTGQDVGEEDVDAGTYNLFARVIDDVNTTKIVNGLAQITVIAAPEPVETGITDPNEDTEFLASADPLLIKFAVDHEEDVLLDLKIDSDDNHQNGNETTILAQRLIEEGTSEDEFSWNGRDSAGNSVADGIYKIVIVVSSGTATPTIVDSEALVFRRTTDGQPLIGMLEPATNVTVEPGGFVLVRWRDEEDGDDESATITLTVSRVGSPTIVETILTGRDATEDDVLDTFTWQVPSSLTPGSYLITGSIDRDAADPPDHTSVAVGQIIIPDPNNP